LVSRAITRQVERQQVPSSNWTRLPRIESIIGKRADQTKLKCLATAKHRHVVKGVIERYTAKPTIDEATFSYWRRAA
jgi:hypothetical protein